MKFTFDEDTVLRLSAIGHGAHGVVALGAPDAWHKLFGATENSECCTRHLGAELCGMAGVLYTISSSDSCSVKAKRNTLKTMAALHAFKAAHMSYDLRQKHIREDVAIGSVALQCLMSGLCAIKGFEKEKETEDAEK